MAKPHRFKAVFEVKVGAKQSDEILKYPKGEWVPSEIAVSLSNTGILTTDLDLEDMNRKRKQCSILYLVSNKQLLLKLKPQI